MPKSYMAASMPRYLRQSRLGHLPAACVIGSHGFTADNGAAMVFDVIMLPPQAFQRMQAYLALQHVIAPAFTMGGFQPVYVLRDIKRLEVPDGEEDAETYARQHFIKVFRIDNPTPSSLAMAAKEDNLSDEEIASIEQAFFAMIKKRKRKNS